MGFQERLSGPHGNLFPENKIKVEVSWVPVKCHNANFYIEKACQCCFSCTNRIYSQWEVHDLRATKMNKCLAVLFFGRKINELTSDSDNLE